MEQERDAQRQTYSLCRLGFGMLSFILLLACFPTLLSLSALSLFVVFGVREPILWVDRQQGWLEWLDPPIIFGSLAGAYLLWGRWNQSGWQRRAGLLVLMCLVDGILWFLDHGHDLGLLLGEIGHQWPRHALGQALGWAEFALLASLSGDLMAHLGIERAPETAKATRALAATGAAVWFLFFVERTDWSEWPLRPRGGNLLEPLYIGFRLIWVITLIQTTALTIATTRQLTRSLQEMDREDEEHDLLRSPSDAGHELLATHKDDPWDTRRPDDPWMAPKWRH